MQAIQAFGLTCRPVGTKKDCAQNESAVTSSSSNSTSSSGPTSLSAVPLLCVSSSTVPRDVVQFVSVQRALFSAPPSAELASFLQRSKQLPEAIRRNRAAMKAAKQSTSAELAEIGALSIEYDQLRAEHSKLRTVIPDNADVLEVRDTMQLPIGLAQVDGQLYFIQRTATMQPHNRQVAAVQLHREACFKNPPYDAALQEGTGSLFEGSQILSLDDVPSMLRLFHGERPSISCCGAAPSTSSARSRSIDCVTVWDQR